MDERLPSRVGPPRVSAVVVAAGSGRRMGAEGNKVFLDLAGTPILARTVAALARTGMVDQIVVVTRPAERAAARRILDRLESPLPDLAYADGGAERADSARNGVAACAPEAEILLVHDGARPFVSRRLVADLIRAARATGAAIPVAPVVDTIKRIRASRVIETVDRAELGRAQTPQAFRAGLLREALERIGDSGFRPTDDAALIEHGGGVVTAVPGDPLNLKITTPIDLAIAHSILPLFDPDLGTRETPP